MGKKASVISVILPGLMIVALILDSKTALQGTAEGLELCIRTVIPSLFPFFFCSVVLTSGIAGKRVKFLSPLNIVCGIPIGAESLFLLGLVGGYPVGAQAVTQAWEEGHLQTADAKRLLGFCSNCGPSFLFGITSVLFTSSAVPWILWGIHILSAVVTGILIPGKAAKKNVAVKEDAKISISDAIGKAVHITANVCGWIILARCMTVFLDKWLLRYFPLHIRLGVVGFLELANGCIGLKDILSEPFRFVMTAGILGFGGLCVGLQTVSVTGSIGTGWYFPGKLFQSSLSIVLAELVAAALYPGNRFHVTTLLLPIAAGLIIYLKQKKEVAFSGKLMYNTR